MLYCALGVPSAYCAYGMNLVYSIACAVHGETQFVAACTPDHLREAFATRGGRPVVLASENLELRVTNTLVKAGAPIAIFAEEPEDAVGFATESRSLDLRVSIQIYSQSVSCIAPYLNLPSLRVLWRPADHTPFVEVLEQIADVLGLDLSEEHWERLKALTLAPGLPDNTPFGDQLNRFSSFGLPMGQYRQRMTREQLDLIHKSLLPYHGILLDRFHPFQWPIALFRDSQMPDKALLGPIDLTGPARHIAFGPLLHLPAGHWVASLSFAVKENLSGNSLYVDVVAGHDITGQGEFVLPSAGIFVFDITFSVVDPRHPVALRLVTQSGAIEGSLQLMWAEARYMEAPQ